jgi:glycosyltransferase involved in cell wall biosynthesis
LREKNRENDVEAPHQIARWTRQLAAVARTDGPRGLERVARRGLSAWLQPKEDRWPVKPEDIAAADLSNIRPSEVVPIEAGDPMVLNWVMMPPTRGSGGHTTIFRMIRHLEAQGHRNRIYFYDPYGGDHRYYARIVQTYFGFDGDVIPLRGKMEPAHAHVATSWPTAYAVYNGAGPGKRFYFVQDFEPLFHPAGAFAALAENTYRMGFHGITAGRWLSERLEADYGMAASFFNFGSDTKDYSNLGRKDRRGVAFYARPETSRRGTELGLMALQIFARRFPDVPIHLYGAEIAGVDFTVTQHGRTTPAQLNEIYNQCRAGVSLSFTNVSLVPHEMLAAGCLPVVNDAPQNRLVLNNASVRYVQPSPHAIADELGRIDQIADFGRVSQTATASVMQNSWDEAAEEVEQIVRRAITMGGKSRTDYAAEC